MRNLLQDLRYGARTLVKNPGFTLVAVLSLGLGIGAVSSVYSMLSAVIFHPVPYSDADEIYLIKNVHTEGGNTHSVSYPLFRDWEERSDGFEYMTVYSGGSYNLTGPQGPEQVHAGYITSSFFPLVQVQPILGRSFLPEEDQIGDTRVVMISEQLWTNRYDARESLIGEGVTLDGESYTVVGIIPASFKFLEVGPADIWVPAADRPWAASRGNGWLRCIGRLNDRVSAEQADASLNAVMAGLRDEHPEDYSKRAVAMEPYGQDNVEDLRVTFYILFGCVGFVLLIACVNVANLLLARVSGRQKEVTIRVALGASRGRLIRQLLTESMLLATLGGITGIFLSLWGMDFITSLLPVEMASFYVDYFEFGMNTEVLVMTMAIALSTGVIFGIVPAIQASKTDLNQNLKEGGGGGGKRHRLLGALVVSEITLALVLLISASLMMQSFQNVQNVDPGFDTDNLLTVSIGLPEKFYTDNDAINRFYTQVEERIAALGSVESVGSSGLLPFTDSNSTNTITIEGLPERAAGDYDYGSIRSVTPDYPQTMGFSLVKGRFLTAQDDNSDVPAVLVNEAMAAKYWPGEDAVGKRFRIGGPQSDEPWMTVVGVLGNVRYSGFTEDYLAEFFVPHAVRPWRFMNVVARTKANPEALASTIRQIVLDIDPNQPLANVETMDSYIAQSVWGNRFNSVLFGVLAAVALILASIGIYGVINYSVSQRTHEIGIRMALGAESGNVLGLIVRQGAKLACIGIFIGIPLAYGLTKLMASILYGVDPGDPITFAVTCIILGGVAILASYVPARKAAKVDPMVALRYE
jgi:putative ABC transport system permease protein